MIHTALKLVLWILFSILLWNSSLSEKQDLYLTWSASKSIGVYLYPHASQQKNNNKSLYHICKTVVSQKYEIETHGTLLSILFFLFTFVCCFFSIRIYLRIGYVYFLQYSFFSIYSYQCVYQKMYNQHANRQNKYQTNNWVRNKLQK